MRIALVSSEVAGIDRLMTVSVTCERGSTTPTELPTRVSLRDFAIGSSRGVAAWVPTL